MNKSRIGAWATALFMAAAMVLPVGTALAAEGKPEIMLGGQGLEGKGKSHVYFGTHDGAPLYSRVLAKEGNNLVMLSEHLLESIVFDDGSDSIVRGTWDQSAAKAWCNTFYTSGFTTEEQAAIPAVSKTETGTVTAPGGSLLGASSLTGERVYFLSAQEASNENYGFAQETDTQDSNRLAQVKGGSSNGNWWLRSAQHVEGEGITRYTGFIMYLGTFNLTNADNDRLYARPAFQLDLTKVLFASPADGGKAGEIGALDTVGATTSNDWKLTLKDGSRSFAVSDTAAKRVNAGNTLSLDYTNAKTGAKEYVSAMLLDNGGNPIYYGRMMAATEANGQVDVTIPAGLAVGEYTLQVFNEQINGDKKTDYASAASEISLTVVNQDNVLPGENEGKAEGLPQTSTQGEKITFTAVGAGMDNVAPVMGDERWKPISWSVNPSGNFADGSYTQSFDTTGMTPGEHKLTITYALERFNGSAWVDTGDNVTQSFPFTLLAAPPQPPQGGGEPSEPGATSAGGTATPGELTGSNPGTGDSSYAWYIIGLALAGGSLLLLARKKVAD